MASLLDKSQKLVDENGNATAYFEDAFAQIIQALGGENAPSVPQQIAEAENPSVLARVKALT